MVSSPGAPWPLPSWAASRDQSALVAELRARFSSLTPGHWSAIGAFVLQSPSPEWRPFALDGMDRLARARPDLSSSFIRGVAAVVWRGASMDARRLRMDALATLAAHRPPLADDAVFDLAEMVSSAPRSGQRLVDTLTAAGAGKGTVRAALLFVGESATTAGRALKCDGLADMLRRRPGLDAMQVRRLAGFVNEGRDLAGRTARFSALQEAADAYPQDSMDALVRTAATLCGAGSEGERRALALQRMAHVLQPPGGIQMTYGYVMVAGVRVPRRVR